MTEGMYPSDSVSAPAETEYRGAGRFAVLALYLGLASVGVLLVLAGWGVYSNQRAEVLDQAEAQLDAIADLKVRALSQWSKDRISEMSIFYDNPTFASLLDSSVPGSDSDLMERMLQIEENPNYRGAYLLGPGDEGDVLARTPGAVFVEEGHIVDSVVPLASLDVTLRDFGVDEAGTVHLSVVVPLSDPDEPGAHVGTLVALIDPSDFLYPLLQEWPVPSESGETLIIRRDGNSALFLNDLRFEDDAALRLRVPIASTEVPAVKAALGEEGPVDGLDYRGVEVVADVRQVPDSPWFLVAKIDSDEALAGLDDQLAAILLLVLAGVLLVILVAALVWRHLRSREFKALYESERDRAWLREMISRSASEIYVVDAETMKVEFTNDGAVRNLGYSREEILQMEAKDIAPDVAGSWKEDWLTPLKEGAREASRTEVEHFRKDGTTYPVEVTVQWFESGYGPAYLVIGNDITERKEAERALKASEERFRRFAENLPAATYLCLNDEAWTMLYLNTGIERITGVPRERFLSGEISYSSLCHPDDVPGMRRSIDASLERGGTYHINYRLIAADGAMRWLEEYGQAISDDGEIRLLGVIFDVTERVRVQEELERHKEDLERLVEERTTNLADANRELDGANEELHSTVAELKIANEELQAVAQDLEEASSAKSQFLAGMSHELRTPLNSIIGFSGILVQGMAGSLTDEQHQQVNMINVSGKRLLSLINDILDLSKIEAGRTEVNAEEFDAIEVIREVAQTIEPQAREKGIEIVVESSAESLMMLTDRGRVQQILINLAGNAVKFTDRGHINLAGATAEDGSWILTVEDTGPGIAQKDLKSIFEPFIQMQGTEKGKPSGTGLGLALSTEYAKLLGGKLEVASKLGEGSRFTLTIPNELG